MSFSVVAPLPYPPQPLVGSGSFGLMSSSGKVSESQGAAGRPLEVAGVEVADQPAAAARAGGAGRPAHQEAQLCEQHHVGRGPAVHGDLGHVVHAAPPLVAVVVAGGADVVRRVVRVRDVIVRVDQTRGDDAVGAVDHRGVSALGRGLAVTAHALDDASVRDEHAAVAVQVVGAEHRAAQQAAPRALAHHAAHAGGGRRQRVVADDLAVLGGAASGALAALAPPSRQSHPGLRLGRPSRRSKARRLHRPTRRRRWRQSPCRRRTRRRPRGPRSRKKPANLRAGGEL
jgi:hypothetical protein